MTYYASPWTIELVRGASEREAHRLADEVRAGRLTREQLQEAADATGDCEPWWALELLDRD